MPSPIVESILSDSTGAFVRFRWHMEPTGANTQVSVFEYDSAGNFAGSEYLRRYHARLRWDRLVSEGWYTLRKPVKV